MVSDEWFDRIYTKIKRAWKQNIHSSELTVELTEYAQSCAEHLNTLPEAFSGDEMLDFMWAACPILVVNALKIPFHHVQWKSNESETKLFLIITLL